MIEKFNPELDGWNGNATTTALIGPPGTGKTTAVMTAWLIPALAEVAPRDVLACSFTKAAAVEMRDRLADKSNVDANDLRLICSTIHSESYRLVRLAGGPKVVWKRRRATTGEAEAPGWESLARPQEELADEAERLWGIARNRWPMDSAADPRAALERTMTRELFRGQRSKFGLSEVHSEVMAQSAQKHDAGALDFVDMLTMSLDVAPDEREIVLIDEAQDLSPLQILVVENWTRRARKTVWVGDPDQGIYAFAGADGSHLTGLVRSESVAARSLQQSYRVPSSAHGIARRLILQNVDREDAPYYPRADVGYLSHCHRDDVAHTAEDAAAGGSVFVLARACAQLGVHAQELAQLGVPFSNERGGSPMGQPKKVNLILAIHDVMATRLVGKDQLLALADAIPGRPRHHWLTDKKKTTMSAVKSMAEGSFVDSRDLRKFHLAADAIRECGSIDAALSEIGKLEYTSPQMAIVGRCGINALRRTPAITLTTMHASKGREAGTVIVDTHAPYPVRRTLESGAPELVEEERRVMYVALTRTMDGLVIVDDDGPFAGLLI